MIAGCDRTPPVSVTRAPTLGNRTDRAGEVIGHTMTSPAECRMWTSAPRTSGVPPWRPALRLLEGLSQIEYPYVFHAEPGDTFPNLKAHTREQCARALYVFHTLKSYLPPQG